MEVKTWQETVMIGKQIDATMDRIEKMDTSYTSAEVELCRTQAEISFKAGQEAEKHRWFLLTDPEKCRDNFTRDIILRARKQAFKEVVEWIEAKQEFLIDPNMVKVFEEVRQAKLKEWGIEG